MKKPERIDLSQEELEALLLRVESGSLQPGDYELIKAMAETIAYLSQAADKKSATIARLIRTLFGSTSEKSEVILGDAESDDSSKAPVPDDGGTAKDDGSDEKKNKKGHGRRSQEEYSGAERISVKHETLSAGDPCPECEKGKVYEQTPSTVVRIRGSAPFSSKVYEFERFRCNLCGAIFTASAPEGVGTQKYDETVVSMIALLKYGSGLPFNRIDKLQEAVGVPLPSSTQWDILEAAVEKFEPVYDELFRQAAAGDIVYNDDTNARILELMGKRRKKLEKPPDRSGLFTSGIVSRADDKTIALYFSGPRHAGENLERLLAVRSPSQGPPIQMCDGLSHNVPAGERTVVANCLAHGRRKFVEIVENFPEEVRHVLEVLKEVYAVDARAREEELSPEERLALHQRESEKPMKKLRKWLNRKIAKRQVEPNSSLGEAITYMTKRWDELTLFLREVGAPLDNNICERVLKKAILHRKNALFFKTENGARVGDLFMSLIHSAELVDANPLEYLNALQRNAEAASAAPSDWMPWNYSAALNSVD